MTGVPGGGDGYGDVDVEAARGAMMLVYELFEENPGASVEQIQSVDGYAEIPERVRRAIEGLSLSERLFVRQVFGELLGSGFSIEFSGIRGY